MKGLSDDELLKQIQESRDDYRRGRFNKLFELDNNILNAREELLVRTEEVTREVVDATNLPPAIKDFFDVLNTDTAIMVSAEDMPEFRRLEDALTEKLSAMEEEIEDKYDVRIYRSAISGRIVEGFVHGEMLRANLDRTSSDPYRIMKVWIEGA